MSNFKISKSHTLGAETIRAKVEYLAGKLEEKHGVKAKWQGDSVIIKRAGVEGRLTFDERTIDISVKLGLLASTFAPRIKHGIERYLDENVS